MNILFTRNVIGLFLSGNMDRFDLLMSDLAILTAPGIPIIYRDQGY